MESLLGALRATSGRVISFVGAGGKTSLLFALAREAAAEWGPARVLVTTTTKMLAPVEGDYEVRFVASPSEAVAAGDAVGRAGRLPVLATGTVPAPEETRDKLVGLPPEWVDEITRRRPDLLILVEADGSGKKPLKVPADHEPVIPASSGVVVAVVGLDALGQPIDATHVQRPEAVAKLAGRAVGDRIDEATMAAVLSDERGCGKGRPRDARMVPVVNQVDSPERLQAARRVAGELRRRGAAEILLTSCLSWPVVVETVRPPRTGAVVLAAGASTRMGRPKQLLPWRGEPLVAAVTRQVLGARVDPVVVVVGHEAEDVGRAIAGLPGKRLQIVHCPEYREGGQSASLQAGLRAMPDEVEAVVFVLCDQPLIRPGNIDVLIARANGSRDIVVPVHGGRRGNPVLFGRAFFDELMAVTGDEGGRAVLRRHPEAVVEVPAGPQVVTDLDTREDYERLLRQAADDHH